MQTVYVISAPSGTGKTTLNRRLVAENPGIEMSVSHTTRRPRDGETDGKHYHFIEKDHFKKMLRAILQFFLLFMKVRRMSFWNPCPVASRL